jgi:hypothetical protein
VPFHIEISRSIRRAWAFNLSSEALRTEVLEPWAANVPVELGGREWDPTKSSLRVLEGPKLDGPELAVGQGWSNAQRSSTDVTASILDELRRSTSTVTVAGGDPGIESALREAGFEVADWADARGAYASRDASRPKPLAVIPLGAEPAGFDVGLAIGAAPKAIFVRTDSAARPPVEPDIPTVTFGGPGDADQLAAQLRELLDES